MALAKAEDVEGSPPERRVFSLPRLSGPALVAFTVVWFAALALAIAAPVVGGHWRSQILHRVKPFRDLGLGYRTDAAGNLRLMAPEASQARQSGVRDGDAILLVDGRAVPQSYAQRTGVADVLGRAPGPEVRITTRSPDGQIRTHHLTRSPRHEAEIYAGSGLTRGLVEGATNAIACLVIAMDILTAVLLFQRRPHDPVAALLSLSLLLTTLVWPVSWGLAAAVDLDWLNGLLLGVGWAGSAISVMVFPSGRFEPRWTLAAALLAILWIALYVFGQGELEMLAFSSLTILNMAAVAALVIRYRRLPAGAERQQVRWALFGIVVGVTAGVVYNIAYFATPPDPRWRVWLPLVATFFMAFGFVAVALGLLVSLLRYRLYDAEAAISRSATVAALGIGLVAVFTATEKLIEILGEEWFGDSVGSAAGAIAAGLAAVLLVPMHRGIDRWAEHRFQHNLVRLRRLPDLLNDLRETAGVERLGAVVVEHVVQALRATGAEIRLADGARIATVGAIGDDPVARPLQDVGCGEVGILLLGRRPDGTMFAKDERQTLADITGPVARAIAIVRLRQARETSWTRQIASLNDRLASLESRAPEAASR